jgi:hypothetical protein
MIDGPSFCLGMFLMGMLWMIRYSITTYGDKK